MRRLDALIVEIREKHQRQCFENPDSSKGDVLIVAHGHILRAFAMRWVGKSLTETSFILEAGSVGTLRYVVVLSMRWFLRNGRGIAIEGIG